MIAAIITFVISIAAIAWVFLVALLCSWVQLTFGVEWAWLVFGLVFAVTASIVVGIADEF